MPVSAFLALAQMFLNKRLIDFCCFHLRSVSFRFIIRLHFHTRYCRQLLTVSTVLTESLTFSAVNHFRLTNKVIE
jgi:hypothetical protein